MNRRRTVIVLAIAALTAGGLLSFRGSPAQAGGFGFSKLNKIQQRLVSSALYNALGPTGQAGITNDNGGGADGAPNAQPQSFAAASSAAGVNGNYFPGASGACASNHGSNIRVNQNCLNVSAPDLQGRSQANNEDFIAEDPLHPNNLVASDNDYVRGDGTCGAAYSLDEGATWTNSTVPDSFSRGASFGGKARAYWQGGGDTSVAWDTRGNAYLSCQLFNRGTVASANPDQSSTFEVFRSTGNQGASWDFTGGQVAFGYDPTGTGAPFEDKQLLAVDNNVGSPFRDRLYVTWTEFAADGSAYIYATHSNDYGQTFSSPVLVSGDNGTLCTNNFGAGTPNGQCNENQFADPFVGSDGALYVAFDNFNNTVAGSENRNQILLAKSTDGGVTFSLPVLVSYYYDLPDCNTYQGAGADSGRACVPEKGGSTVSVFRATNYPSGAVNPTDSSEVVVTLGSYINKHSNESNGCAPNGIAGDGNNQYIGVKTAGACNNDILLSVSHNSGGTFTGASTDPRTEAVVTQGDDAATTDQWWQWAAFTKGGRLAVDYYDRRYGKDESNGNSDITLSEAGAGDLGDFESQRVTTSSMPPPTQFPGPNGGVFYGDYTGLTVVGDDAHPIWSDTRQVDLFVCPGTAVPGVPPALCTATEVTGLQANDQDAFTANVHIPPDPD